MRPRKDCQTSFRGKRVVLTERDELAYARVLREFDPDIRSIDEIYRPGRAAPDRPDDLRREDSREVSLLAFPPDAKERARLCREGGVSDIDLAIRLTFDRSPWYRASRERKWAFEELVDWGAVSVAFPMGDEDLKRFALKVLRLVDKVTWKRGLFGLDACRWSQAGGSVRRGLGNGILIDPSEKIELNKYYDDRLWSDGLPDRTAATTPRQGIGPEPVESAPVKLPSQGSARVGCGIE